MKNGHLTKKNPNVLRQSVVVRSSAALFLAMFFLCVGVPAISAHAEVHKVVDDDAEGGVLTVYRMSVTPAPVPVPALRHRLTVSPLDCQPGNAAAYYRRALVDSEPETLWGQLSQQFGEELDDWYSISSTPLSDLPLNRLREASSLSEQNIETHIRPATFRRDCDWDLGIEDMRGPQLVMVLLPEFHATRTISRFLSLRTRVAIADGDFDKALDHLRMNFRLAVNVGQEPLLICGLIGIAEASIAQQQIIEWIAAEDSPNLYWALAELPHPLIDLNRAVQFEMSLGPRIFPFIADAETTKHAPEEWSRLFADALKDYSQLFDSPRLGPLDGAWRQAVVAASSVAVYPHAKKRLIASGIAAERIEQMPVGQVLAMDTLQEWNRISNEVQKQWYLPFHLSRKQNTADLFRYDGPEDAIRRGYGFLLAAGLLPSLEAVRSADARIEWQMRAVQVIEALRLHAANTAKLPAKLTDVTEVYVPVNPATNNAYQYRLENDTAILDLPFTDGFAGIAYRFEIKLDNAAP
ncbi:MAG: hypothetical protein R3E01_27405 [Pirellulaceae bacterium]|nr:hypothetical protein [Planctomycetales bacterium]